VIALDPYERWTRRAPRDGLESWFATRIEVRAFPGKGPNSGPSASPTKPTEARERAPAIAALRVREELHVVPQRPERLVGTVVPRRIVIRIAVARVILDPRAGALLPWKANKRMTRKGTRLLARIDPLRLERALEAVAIPTVVRRAEVSP
jgi:hypothetical protein